MPVKSVMRAAIITTIKANKLVTPLKKKKNESNSEYMLHKILVPRTTARSIANTRFILDILTTRVCFQVILHYRRHLEGREERMKELAALETFIDLPSWEEGSHNDAARHRNWLHCVLAVGYDWQHLLISVTFQYGFKSGNTDSLNFVVCSWTM